MGSLCEVYEATDPALGKRVALKVLRADTVGEPGAAERIPSEARATSAVRHRGVIDVLELGTLDDGRPFLAMPLLEGEGLDRWLERKEPRPLPAVLGILEELLDVLVAVHAAGLLHREVQPANVFRARDAASSSMYLKLLDFGLAVGVGARGTGARGGEPGRSGVRRTGVPARGAGHRTEQSLLGGGGRLRASHRQRALRTRGQGRRRRPGARWASLVARLGAAPSDRGGGEVARARAGEETRVRRRGAGPGARAPRTSREALEVEAREPALTLARSLPGETKGAEGVPKTPAKSAPKLVPRRPPPEVRVATAAIVEIPEPEPAATVSLALADAFRGAALEHLSTQDRLPPFPVAAMRVVQLASAGDPEVTELVKLVNQDPALIAQILKTANSAFASRSVEIKTVRDAVVRLGAKEVAAAAAATATSSVYKTAESNPNAFPALRRRLGIEALASAFAGGFVALDQRGVPADEVFGGGLLHDIGKLLALDALGSSEVTSKLEGFDPATQVEPLLEVVHEDLGAPDRRGLEAAGLYT